MGSKYHRVKSASNVCTKAPSENARREAQPARPKHIGIEVDEMFRIMAQFDDENRRLKLLAEELRGQIARLVTTPHHRH